MFKFSKRIQFLIEMLLILGILMGGLGVRLYKINNPIADWHSWRQADTASVSKIYFEKGIDLMHPRYHDISRIQTGMMNRNGWRMVEFPIYNAIHASVAHVVDLPETIKLPKKELPIAIPEFETIGRLISVVFSVISILFIYKIGKDLYGSGVGLASAFFFAFMPYNIYFSRVILPEPMAVMTMTVSFWFFVNFIKKDNYWSLYVSAVFFAMAMLLKPFVFFYFPAYAYLAVKKFGVKALAQNIKFMLALDIALIPFFVWRVWINEFPAGIPHFGWAFNGDKIRFRPSFFKWIFSERIGKLMLGSWGLIPFGYGFIKARDLTLQFMALGMFGYVSVIATASVRHDYYQTLLVPFVCLVLGYGSFEMWSVKTNKFTTRVVLVVAIWVMMITGLTEVKPFYAINHPEIVEAGKALQKYAEKDALVIAPYNGDTAFLYQTGHSGWPVVDESFDEIIGKGARYFVTVNFADRDTAYVEKRFTVLEKTNTYMVAELKEK